MSSDLTECIRILGIDPGSRLTGFGVLDCDRNTTSYVASGSINSASGSFPERLKMIYRSISTIVAEFRPGVVVVESVFMHRNPSSALKLGHARSAAICATFALELEVVEYAPREIKLAIVGTGAASKEQVQHMVRQLLRLEGSPSPDAADALAAALCHANQRRLNRTMTAAALVAKVR